MLPVDKYPYQPGPSKPTEYTPGINLRDPEPSSYIVTQTESQYSDPKQAKTELKNQFVLTRPKPGG